MITPSATVLPLYDRERAARSQRMKPVDHVLAEDDQVIYQVFDALLAAVPPHLIECDPPGAAVFGRVLDDDAGDLGHELKRIRRWPTSSPVIRVRLWRDIVRSGQADHVQPGVPKYQQLAELIRQRILDGTYLAGEQLPPEVSLMEETGYSRDTVRAAVKVLRESGWVTVTHGLGTFVNPPELRRDGSSS